MLSGGGHKTEGSADIDVGNIHVPMLVSCEWLLETFALPGFLVARVEDNSIPEHTVNRTGTAGDDVCVDHHVGQSAISLKWMIEVELDDGLLLVIPQPVISGYP